MLFVDERIDLDAEEVTTKTTRPGTQFGVLLEEEMMQVLDTNANLK